MMRFVTFMAVVGMVFVGVAFYNGWFVATPKAHQEARKMADDALDTSRDVVNRGFDAAEKSLNNSNK